MVGCELCDTLGLSQTWSRSKRLFGETWQSKFDVWVKVYFDAFRFFESAEQTCQWLKDCLYMCCGWLERSVCESRFDQNVKWVSRIISSQNWFPSPRVLRTRASVAKLLIPTFTTLLSGPGRFVWDFVVKGELFWWFVHVPRKDLGWVKEVSDGGTAQRVRVTLTARDGEGRTRGPWKTHPCRASGARRVGEGGWCGPRGLARGARRRPHPPRRRPPVLPSAAHRRTPLGL